MALRNCNSVAPANVTFARTWWWNTTRIPMHPIPTARRILSLRITYPTHGKAIQIPDVRRREHADSSSMIVSWLCWVCRLQKRAIVSILECTIFIGWWLSIITRIQLGTSQNFLTIFYHPAWSATMNSDSLSSEGNLLPRTNLIALIQLMKKNHARRKRNAFAINTSIYHS